MIGALDAYEVEHISAILAEGDYTDLGENGVQGRRALRSRSNQSINIAIVTLGGTHWTNNLAIRDYLRSHPERRDQYSALKQQIIASGTDQLLAYSSCKAPFILELLEEAFMWEINGNCE